MQQRLGREMDVSVKILLLGDSGTGKTSLVQRYMYGPGAEEEQAVRSSVYDPDVAVKKVVMDGKTVKAFLHDGVKRESSFASQTAVLPSSYRNVDTVMLVYSVDDIQSLQALQDCWLTEYTSYQNITDPSWVIVGNKNDLPLDTERETLDMIAGRLPECVCLFASAKTGKNVPEVFEIAIRKGLKKRTEKEKTITLHSEPRTSRKNSCCTIA